jgi:hypothetical protein
LEEELTMVDEKELQLQTAWNPATNESKADFDTLAAPLVEEGGAWLGLAVLCYSILSSLATHANDSEIGGIKSETVPSEASDDHLEPVGSGVGLAIWLGMLIDGVPEALVIGTYWYGGCSSRARH